MLFQFFAFYSVFIAIFAFIIYKWKFERIIKMTKNWPKAPSYPVIGNWYLCFGAAPEEMLNKFMENAAEYCRNKSGLFWFGWQAVCFLGDPADLKIMLTSKSCINKAMHYDCLRDWLRDGLLVSKDKQWHRQRKLLTPAFHFTILKDYVDVFEKHSKIFVEKLQRYAKEGRSCDFFNDVALLAVDVICETAMGITTIEAQANKNTELVNALEIVTNIAHHRMCDPLHFFFFTHRFTALYRKEKAALAILHGFAENVIRNRRKELLLKEHKGNDEHKMDVKEKQKITFLDVLLESTIDGKPLTDIEIRQEIDTFIFGAHSTTASASSFFFYNMAIHPEYQQKCFEEIISVLGKDKTEPVTFDDLNRLHFVQLCIKETLRMYPSIPIIGRTVTEDVHLSDGRIMPAGVNVGSLTYYVGRSEELFPQPNTFKPERFDVEMSTEKTHPFAYIPFSAGQRNCIGQKYALLELKSIIVNVLRHFVVEYDGDPKKEPHLTVELVLRTKEPLMFKLKERQY